MNPDILDKILRAIIVFLHVEKLGPLGNVSVLVVAEVVVEVRSKAVLSVAVLLQHPVPAQPLPVAVVLHPAPTTPWPSRVLRTSSKLPTSTL